MSKPVSSVKKFLESIGSVGKKIFYNPYKKIGVSWLTVRKFKYFSRPGLQTHQLFKHETYFYGINEYFYGLREIFLNEPYKQQFPEHAFVIDCGAHIGLSVLYVKKICPTAHVVAYEPDKKNFELLQKNVNSHLLQDVELKNEAVWNEDTLLDFIQDGNMGSKIVQSMENTAVKVPAVRLNNIINRTVDFLKLDIEGAEYTVIKDLSDKMHYVRNLFIEYHGTFQQNNELCEILNMLVNSGFHFYIKEAHLLYDHPFYHDNSSKDFDVQLNIFAMRKQSA